MDFLQLVKILVLMNLKSYAWRVEVAKATSEHITQVF
jgi:hypothetical protein